MSFSIKELRCLTGSDSYKRTRCIKSSSFKYVVTQTYRQATKRNIGLPETFLLIAWAVLSKSSNLKGTQDFWWPDVDRTSQHLLLPSTFDVKLPIKW